MGASALVSEHAMAFRTRFGRVRVFVFTGLFSFPFTRYRYDKREGGSIVIHLVDDEPEKMPDWSAEQWDTFRKAHICAQGNYSYQRSSLVFPVESDELLERKLAYTLLGPIAGYLRRFDPQTTLPMDFDAALDSYFVQTTIRLLDRPRGHENARNEGPSIQTFYVPMEMRLWVECLPSQFEQVAAIYREQGFAPFRQHTEKPAFDWNHSAAFGYPYAIRVAHESVSGVIKEALQHNRPGKGDPEYMHQIRFSTVDANSLRITTYTTGEPIETIVSARVQRALDACVNLWTLQEVLREAHPGVLKMHVDKRQYNHAWNKDTICVSVLAIWPDGDFPAWRNRIHLYPTDHLPKRKVMKSA